MEQFLVSAVSVAAAEIGDKTQLLALVLAARFRKPVPIMTGIVIATLANHGIAAGMGAWLAANLDGRALQWFVAASFIGVGAWMLIPDHAPSTGMSRKYQGAFLATLVSFFLVEIGDKTEIATALLAAHYHAMLPVLAGSTIGMVAANLPVVLIGGFAADKLPLKLIHGVAAAIFIVLGLIALWAGLRQGG